MTKRTRETSFNIDTDNEKYWDIIQTKGLEYDNSMGLWWGGIINGVNKTKIYDTIKKNRELNGITNVILTYLRLLNIAYNLRIPKHTDETESVKLLCYTNSKRLQSGFNRKHSWNSYFKDFAVSQIIKTSTFTPHSGFYRLHKILQSIRYNPFLSSAHIDKICELVYSKLRVKAIIYKFYNTLRLRLKSKSINDVTIHLEDISSLDDSEKYEIKITHTKHFTFTLENLSNIINTSLLNADPENKLIPQPNWPINPYNRTKFSVRDIYGIYNKIKNSGRHVPIVFELFIKSDCSIVNMLHFHRKYFTEHSSLQYVRELELSTLQSLVMDYVNTHNERRILRIHDRHLYNDFKYCKHCILQTLKKDRSVFTRLIRDSIYFDNGVITLNRWLLSQKDFQIKNPHLNTAVHRHIKCEYELAKPTGSPFISERDLTEEELSSLSYSDDDIDGEDISDDVVYDDYDASGTWYEGGGGTALYTFLSNTGDGITITVDTTPTPISTLLAEDPDTVWANGDLADILTDDCTDD